MFNAMNQGSIVGFNQFTCRCFIYKGIAHFCHIQTITQIAGKIIPPEIKPIKKPSIAMTGLWAPPA
jgi:hypothetical protein